MLKGKTAARFRMQMHRWCESLLVTDSVRYLFSRHQSKTVSFIFWRSDQGLFCFSKIIYKRIFMNTKPCINNTIPALIMTRLATFHMQHSGHYSIKKKKVSASLLLKVLLKDLYARVIQIRILQNGTACDIEWKFNWKCPWLCELLLKNSWPWLETRIL